MIAINTQMDRSSMGDDDRWQAVLNRDRGRDGQFVLAVRTTGIYCRPSCPARKPNRENVSFFADADAAERAGFRACRRCRPRATLAPKEAMVARATAWLDAHTEERVTLARLAEAVGVQSRPFATNIYAGHRCFATAIRGGAAAGGREIPPAQRG